MLAEVEININDAFDSLSRSDQVEFTTYCLDNLTDADLQDVLEQYQSDTSDETLIRILKRRGYKVEEK